MTAPIPLEEAWTRLLSMIEPLGSELVAVDDAVGRVLAEPLVAQRTQPWADLSAMDGFACAGEGPWRITGESRAGQAFDDVVTSGEAVRISTGAAVPEGADRILVVEEALHEGRELAATQAPEPGRHIRRRGFDFAFGDILVEAGQRVSPAGLALARASGSGTLPVSRAPRVALIECGDELVADPRECPDDRLPASNGAMLGAMASQAGAIVQRIGPVADRKSALREAIEAARGNDLIVTMGGASVGDYDLVKPVLEELGADLAFWRVAIRPGKPLLVARWEGTLILGLPGNPVSSFVTSKLFMLPAIRALSGEARPLPVPIPITLRGSLPEGGLRREFHRARLVDGEACPIEERDSSALRALAQADLLIDRPAHADEAKAGTPVPCYRIGNGANA